MKATALKFIQPYEVFLLSIHRRGIYQLNNLLPYLCTAFIRVTFTKMKTMQLCNTILAVPMSGVTVCVKPLYKQIAKPIAISIMLSYPINKKEHMWLCIVLTQITEKDQLIPFMLITPPYHQHQTLSTLCSFMIYCQHLS